MVIDSRFSHIDKEVLGAQLKRYEESVMRESVNKVLNEVDIPLNSQIISAFINLNNLRKNYRIYEKMMQENLSDSHIHDELNLASSLYIPDTDMDIIKLEVKKEISKKYRISLNNTKIPIIEQMFLNMFPLIYSDFFFQDDFIEFNDATLISFDKLMYIKHKRNLERRNFTKVELSLYWDIYYDYVEILNIKSSISGDVNIDYNVKHTEPILIFIRFLEDINKLNSMITDETSMRSFVKETCRTLIKAKEADLITLNKYSEDNSLVNYLSSVKYKEEVENEQISKGNG